MAYDHYLLEPTALTEALESINEEHEEIVSSFYLADSNQVCIIIKRDIKPEQALKSFFGRDDDDS